MTTFSLLSIKYDFISMKALEHQRVSLPSVDTMVVGELIYPPGSMVP